VRPFQRRSALFREGARLHYLTILALTIWRLSGHAYEDIVSKRLADIGKQEYEKLASLKLLGKIKSERTVWGYIGNAETLGLVVTSGRSTVTKGHVRARYLSLTAFGEALSYLHETSGAPPASPELLDTEKMLYFKRFLEIDQQWKGQWFSKVVSTLPENEFLEQKVLVPLIADATGLSEKYSPSGVIHRVVPKIQWLYDLDLVGVDETRTRYGLTGKGTRFRDNQKAAWDVNSHYACIAYAYGLRTNRADEETVRNTLRSVYGTLASLYERPPRYVAIATLRYLLGTLLLAQGYVLEDTAFDAVVLRLRELGQVDLTPSPPTAAKGQPIVSSEGRFDLIAVTA